MKAMARGDMVTVVPRSDHNRVVRFPKIRKIGSHWWSRDLFPKIRTIGQRKTWNREQDCIVLLGNDFAG